MSRLRHGASLLVLSEYSSKLLIYGVALMQMRKMAPTEFGRLATALAICQSLAIAADGGMAQVVAQKIAEHGQKYRHRLEEIFGLRFAIMGLLVVGVVALTFVVDVSISRLSMAALVLGISLFSFVDFIAWGLKGFRNVGLSASVQVGSRFTLFVFCATVLSLKGTVDAFICAYFLSGILVAAAAWVTFGRRVYRPQLRRPTLAAIRNVLGDIAPFFGFYIGGVLMSRVDIMLVSHFCGQREAGLYAAASSVIEGFSLAPYALFGFLMPVFASFAQDLGKQRQILRKSLFPFVLLSAGLVGMVMAAVKPLFLHVINENFQRSIPFAQLLAWTLAPISLSYLFSAMLMGASRLRAMSAAMMAGVVAMATFDGIFLARLGAGAAPLGRFVGSAVVLSGMAWALFWHDAFKRDAAKLASFFAGGYKLGCRFADKVKIIEMLLWWKVVDKSGPLLTWLKPPRAFTMKFKGRTFPVHVPVDSSFPQSFYEVFVRQDYQHPRLDDPDVILDVGANCGLAALFLSCLYPGATVHAFEPCRQNFDLLKRNTQGFENIVTHRFGLYSSKGFKKLTVSPRGGNNSLFTKGTFFEEIEVNTLDDFLSDQNISHVDLLKIDVEGAENDVLIPSNALADISIVIGEMHPHLTNQQLLMTTLAINFDVKVFERDNPIICCVNKSILATQVVCA